MPAHNLRNFEVDVRRCTQRRVPYNTADLVLLWSPTSLGDVPY